MALAPGLVLAAVLLLTSPGLHRSSPLPLCPESCTCQRDSLLNCSSSGLSLVPQHIQDSVTELDLSHNVLESFTLHQLHHNLQKVWLGNNSITHLSLCIKRNLEAQYFRDRRVHRLRPWRGWRFMCWAPTLQLLSVERNQLVELPEGLRYCTSVQVLQLSFNRISTLQSEDVRGLRQLKELHLQNNLITNIHPQMFQHLDQLRVLDLSFNMLTRLHPLMYPSLRNLGVDVRLSGNSWQCDCNMYSLQSWMAYDSWKGLQTWSVVCASPSAHSGTDLLQVPTEDLNCIDAENSPKLHQDMTVNKGSEILLTCFTQDPLWWTPNGQASVVQPEGGLLISDITEAYTGLYVCVSESEQKIISVYNLQISETRGTKRKARSLPQYSQEIILPYTLNRMGQNGTVSQSHLALAVCLSVFITFLIAFILGVLARPFICSLWGRVTKKKSSSAPNSVPLEQQQQQYDNEAFASGEDLEDLQPHRERRVTFSDIPENITVQYYDTVASEDQESVNTDVFENEPREAEKHKHTDGDSDDDEKGVSGTDHTGTVEYEHIPDQERTSLSSHSSHSSLSDKEDKKDQGDHSKSKSPQVSEDTIQQRADLSTVTIVEVPQITTEDRDDIPGFSSEPFTDWSPHDKWQDGEEQFDFSDSVRSTSARSSILNSSFNDSKVIVLPSLDKQRVDSMSSSSSSVSDDEPTQYTVNPDSEDEEDTERYRNHRLIHNINPGLTNTPLRQDEKPVMRAEHSFSSHSSESDEEQMHYKVQQDTREEEGMGKGLSLGGTSSKNQLERKVPSEVSSSSSSESEAEIKDLKVENKMNEPKPLLTDQCLPKNISAKLTVTGSSSSDENEDETIKAAKMQEVGDEQNHQWPALDLEHNPTIKRRLDFKVTPSSSSSEILKDNAAQINKHEKGGAEEPSPTVDLVQIKRPLDEKAPSPPHESSSSSDSEDETTNQGVKQNQEMKFPNQESKTVTQDPELQWSAHNVDRVTPNRTYFDTKPSSLETDSSSSTDSEDETKFQKKKTEVETHRPATDLEGTTIVKRCPDIKAPSSPPESSSSSDSEDEDVKLEQEKSHLGKFPKQPYTSVSNDPESKWSSLHLEQIPPIKRRLDIKSPSQQSDSSSSSDSDGERVNHEVKQTQEKQFSAKLPEQASKPVSHEPESKWPTLDLENIPSIKRRLDIKAPTAKFESSSSSDSDGERVSHEVKQTQEKQFSAKLPEQASKPVSHEPESKWPTLDLENIPSIKGRLDIKAPTAKFESSSSSDSEGDTTHRKDKPRPKEEDISKHLFQESQKVTQDENTWPALDLGQVTPLKRRLDIKAPSTPPKSSHSESDDDKIQQMPHKQGKTGVGMFLNKESKRPLDIKSPSKESDSSSSSDSDDERVNHEVKQTQEKQFSAKLPNQISKPVSHEPESKWPTLDLENIPSIKRRLDIKAPTAKFESSSSSDSDGERVNHEVKQMQEKQFSAKLPEQASKPVSHEPESKWPTLNLEHIPSIKRRLDIKAPSAECDSPSDSDSEDEATQNTDKSRPKEGDIVKHQLHRLQSSSSSDSEEEGANQKVKQKQENAYSTKVKKQDSITVSHDPETQWPALHLEQVTKIKWRLDIKAPSPVSDSSSSGDTKDKSTHHTEKQDLETHWPSIDLERGRHLKRRLDIKAPTPDSSSSSDSEDETKNYYEKPEKVQKHKTELPLKGSQTVSNNPDTQWPVVNLEHNIHVKRRLDVKLASSSSSSTLPEEINTTRPLEIKPTSPAHDSSSSSDSEDETTHQIVVQKPGKAEITAPAFQGSPAGHVPQPRWPSVDLSSITRINRRLDIKAPSPPPDSSSSGGSSHSVKMEEIKKISLSSSSDEEEAALDQPLTVEKHKTNMGYVKDPYLKRRLNVRAPPQQGDSSNSDTDRKLSSPTVKYESNTSDGGFTKTEQQNKLHNSGIPQISRRLDIKAPSQQPDAVHSSGSSGSSSSDSEDENRNHKAELGIQTSAISKGTQKDFIRTPKTPIMNISQSPKTSSVTLEKYTAITEGSNTTTDSRDTTPEPNQELQSRWATMNLGISRFRKRLDIMSRTNEPPKLPSSPLPDSPSSSSSSESEPEKKSGAKTKSSLKDQVDNSVKVEEPLRTDSSLPTNWEKSNQNPVLSGFGVQHVDRHLDIKVRQKTAAPPALQQQFEHSSISNNKRDVNIKASSPKESSSSSSEEETSSHRVPDLTSGIPRVKRSLYIKAPSPPPSDSSSSFSESESSHASKLTSLTEEPIIPYKRTIIKSSLSATSTSSGTDGQWHRNKEAGKLSLAQENSSSHLSFDDIVKRKIQQSKHRVDADLPASIRWTGISSSLSDHSTPSLRIQQIPPTVPDHPLESSSSESEDKIKQDEVTTNRTLMHKYSSFSSSGASLASSKALEQSDNSSWSANDISRTLPEDRKERKGLSALKAMSSERREWDIKHDDVDKSPVFVNRSSQSGTSLNYQTPDTLLSPTSDRSPADMLYSISRYRRHLNENTGPPQEAPPPVPATPLPDEAVELTWSSSQSSKGQS